MPDPFVPLAKPPTEPPLTAEQILLGERVDECDRIKLYDPAKYERFIKDWAYHFLQTVEKKYDRIGHFGGSGDLGRDVVAYYPVVPPSTDLNFDIYQCKHYAHALYPGDLWPEIGKLCFFTWKGEFRVPLAYYFMGPQDLGPEAGRLFEDPTKLKSEFLANWDKIPKALTRQLDTTTTPAFQAFVKAFDFTVFKTKPMHEVVAEFRQTPYYPGRFGGGLVKPPPPDPVPPAAIAAHELVYTNELLEAYREHVTDPTLAHADLGKHADLHDHFGRCRERFYCAESLREFSKASLPAESGFHIVQEEVYGGVIDTVAMTFASGYVRVVEVTKVAQSLSIQGHPLRTYLKPKNLHGICHQLVNDGRFRWIK